MADRVVKVRLTAQVAEYVQGMEQAAARTRDLGSEADRMAERGKAFDVLGKSMLAVGTIAAVAVGIAVSKFMEFDAAMSNVEAATNESADNMNRLREAALDAGARTVFSATEAANAIEELGKAGVSTQDILDGGLDGALDLAAAGGLGVAEAAGIAAVALKTFGLRGTDMSHVADLLAAGAGKAMGDVTDLSAALNQAGLVAEGTGLSIEETTAGLAAFASAGLLGSDAGTSFKSMLQRLTPQSAEAKSKMEELGISAYDAQGQFVGLSAFAGNLKDSLKSLTPEQRNAALAVIFGSDAVRAANVLYNEGAEGIDEWTTAVNDQGYASEQAAKRLDNLSGDVEGLGGAFDTALIKTGSGANDVLRDMTQTLTAVVAAYGELPAPMQQGVLAGVALAAAVGLAGGAFLLAIPKVAEFRAALITLEPAAPRAIGALRSVLGILGGPWGLAITAGIAALTAFGVSQANQASEIKALTGTLDEQSGALTENSRKWIASKLQDGGILDAAKAAGIGLEDLTNAIINQGPALDEVQTKIADYYETLKDTKGTDAQAEIRRNSELLKSSIPQLADQVNKAKDAFDNEAEAAGASSDAHGEGAATAEEAAKAYLEESKSVDALQSQLTQLIDAINDVNGVNQDAITANSDYQEALAAADEQIRLIAEGTEGYAATLDLSTEAGRNNTDLLIDLADKSQTAAKAQFDLDGNTANYRATLEAGRQAVYDRALALTGNADAAQLLTDKIYAIPTEREFTMIAETADAQNKISALADTIAWVQRKAAEGVRISATVTGTNIPVLPGQEYATGGYTGPGPKFRPAGVVHADEFVSTKETLARPGNRAVLEYMHAGGSMTGYADGGATTRWQGPVSYATASAPQIVNVTAPSGGERPIYMDGSLFGVMRELANGEARIVVNDYETSSRVGLENGLGR